MWIQTIQLKTRLHEQLGSTVAVRGRANSHPPHFRILYIILAASNLCKNLIIWIAAQPRNVSLSEGGGSKSNQASWTSVAEPEPSFLG